MNSIGSTKREAAGHGNRSGTAVPWFSAVVRSPRLVFALMGLLGATTLQVIAAEPVSTPDATTPVDADYLRYGKETAMSAKAALGSQLKQAINAGGTVFAIDFCQVNAIPITSRTAVEYNASLKRVSDLPRNPGNAASEVELEYIAATKAALATGKEPSPRLQEIGGRMVAYYPIVTNGMCLQCHGTPGEELQADTGAALKARYPEDQAIGYGLNELRGLFVVSMEKP